jgi:ABC-type lipoprotein release transport system permease subunit
MNGLAIASMVLGIVWIYWVGSILALLFGYIAKRQIAERNEQGAGFATAGIVLGWVGIGALVLVVVIAIIVGLTDSNMSWE